MNIFLVVIAIAALAAIAAIASAAFSAAIAAIASALLTAATAATAALAIATRIVGIAISLYTFIIAFLLPRKGLRLALHILGMLTFFDLHPLFLGERCDITDGGRFAFGLFFSKFQLDQAQPCHWCFAHSIYYTFKRKSIAKVVWKK